MSNENENEDGVEINLGEMFFYMVRRWYVFLLAVVGSVLAGLVICLFMIAPKYRSTTKIIILGQIADDALTYEDLQLSKQLTKDYEELIVSRDVMEAVIDECSLNDKYESLLKKVDVESITDTRIISITAEAGSPSSAREIAESVCENSIAKIGEVTDARAVNVVEKANLPEEPSSPSTGKWVLFSALLGFIAVLVVLLVRFISDDRIKSGDDAEKYLDLSVLAMIPDLESARKAHGGYGGYGRSGGDMYKNKNGNTRGNAARGGGSAGGRR